MKNLNWELIITTLATTIVAIILFQAFTYQKVNLATGDLSTQVGIPGASSAESGDESDEG